MLSRVCLTDNAVHFPMDAIIETGAEVALGKVAALFKDGGELVSGAAAESAQVNATVSAQGKGEKILVFKFKFKRKKQYKRTQGHRQDYTEVRVRDIVA